jgi:hypothetical protein
MPWRKPLLKPITLVDGRVLKTLLDVQEVIVPEDLSKNPAARRALELLLEASETGDPADIQVATDQVMIVLSQRRLLA